MDRKQVTRPAFQKPYFRPGISNLRYYSKKSGIYFIRRGKKLRYIGHSGYDLYKTISRHFQSWDDPSQVRATYPQMGTSVMVRLMSPAKATTEEERLIRKYNPPDNTMKYKPQHEQ